MSQETKNKNLIDLLKTIDPATNASYGGKRKLSKIINEMMKFFQKSYPQIPRCQVALKSSEIEKIDDPLNIPSKPSDTKTEDHEHILTKNNASEANLS